MRDIWRKEHPNIPQFHCRNSRVLRAKLGMRSRYRPRHISQAMKPESLRPFGTGIGAGFVATIVLPIFMVVKQMMGLMPQLNPVEMNTQMMGAQTPLVGWIVHFLIGTVLWGILYALIAPRLPGAHWFRGILFATGAWLLMMITLMPMAGAGLFGLKMGLMAPIATLILHWIYGAVLGGLYGTWSSRQERGEPVLGVGTHAHR